MRTVLVVIAALALGFFLGRSSLTAPLENSPEATFARDMRAHHIQAVDMATRIRDRTSNSELKLLATDMLLTQQNELGQMQAWLNTWGLPLTGREPVMNGNTQNMGMTSRSQVSSLSTLPIAQAEIKFLQLMIRHHQGGVYMAQDILKTSQQPLVATLANGIIRNQKIEIDAMNSFLQKRNAQALPPLEPTKMQHK